MGELIGKSRSSFSRNLWVHRRWSTQLSGLSFIFSFFAVVLTSVKGEAWVEEMTPTLTLWQWVTLTLLFALLWLFETGYRSHRSMLTRLLKAENDLRERRTPKVSLTFKGNFGYHVGSGPSRRVYAVEVHNNTASILEKCQLLIYAAPNGDDLGKGNSDVPWPASDLFTLRQDDCRELDFCSVIIGKDVKALTVHLFRQEGERFVPVQSAGYTFAPMILKLKLVSDKSAAAEMTLKATRIESGDWTIEEVSSSLPA